MTEADVFKLQLAMRSARLAKLVKLDAPPIILANEIDLLLRAAWGRLPDQMALVTARWNRRCARASVGFCGHCGRQRDDAPATDFCAACLAEASGDWEPGVGDEPLPLPPSTQGGE